MRSNWGRHITYSLFGESHGPGIGITLHHLPAGFRPDLDGIRRELDRRRPGTGTHATPRQETDSFEFLSGFFEGRLTGAPLTVFFRNQDTRSGDYAQLSHIPRPSHADYAASVKYGGAQDHRGGGHFSGRLTAPLVFAGTLAAQLLEAQGIRVFAHLLRIGSASEPGFHPLGEGLDPGLHDALKASALPTVTVEGRVSMQQEIETARKDGDSVGGQVEVAVTGIPAGIGEPVFESLESQLAHLLFSIPGVKAVEFGAGTAFAGMRGSEANDPWGLEEGSVRSATNNSGGINGGISNGMPVIFRATFRPTPSISKAQASVDLREGSEAVLEIQGRHDPCIVPRACPVVEAVTAMAVLEALLDQKSNLQEEWR